MSNDALPPAKQDLLAGFLSYLVPGLGQIYQGRILKGALFLVCIYGLFLYGMALGSWKNVFLPQATRGANKRLGPSLYDDLLARPQFLGQVWAGIIVWPAVYQYLDYDEEAETGHLFGTFERTPYESPDPPFDSTQKFSTKLAPESYQGKTLNELQMEGDKSYDLGWVYTVVAGVLNILVIYDAVAGPAFSAQALARSKEESRKHADGAVAATH